MRFYSVAICGLMLAAIAASACVDSAGAEQVKTAPSLYNTMKEEMAKQGMVQNGFPAPTRNYGMKTTTPYKPPVKAKVEKAAPVEAAPAPTKTSRVDTIMKAYRAKDEEKAPAKAEEKEDARDDAPMTLRVQKSDAPEAPPRLIDVR